MDAPNRNILFASTFVEELSGTELDAVCIPPGSRSTPLSYAFAQHDSFEVFSHLDERSAAYFCLGRARNTGVPTPVLSTSGTAAVNFHPAVVEAYHSCVPMIVLTADRPTELQDSGANQTIDQTKLYGDAVRWFHQMPEPAPEERKLNAYREKGIRALARATASPAGPVHLNFPFRKPLHPREVPEDLPDPTGPSTSRDTPGQFEETRSPTRVPATPDVKAVADAVNSAGTGLLITGPERGRPISPAEITRLSRETGFPIMADPLSNLRFGPHVQEAVVLGGYDGYMTGSFFDEYGEPDVVLRFGAVPTSKSLKNVLSSVDADQFLINSGGFWQDPDFSCRRCVDADPDAFIDSLLPELDRDLHQDDWEQRLEKIEEAYWSHLQQSPADDAVESCYVRELIQQVPGNSTMFVSNSMPVRDVDRFGQPREEPITVFGNRGASGIDGITSTALGVASTTREPVYLVTGDLAFYHDMNGLLAIHRFDLPITIILLNNDGGGIFHKLPIESYDPPFTDLFRTPHSINFSGCKDVYNLDYANVNTLVEFRSELEAVQHSSSGSVIEVNVDAEKSHRHRESLKNDVIGSVL